MSTEAVAPAAPVRKFAIVEQMGHRRFGAEVREVEFCGAKLLECVLVTEPPIVLQIHPQSLYAITQCSEDQARKVNTPWGLPSEVRALLPSPEPEPVPVMVRRPTFEHDPLDLTFRLPTAMNFDERRAAVVYLRACFDAHALTVERPDDHALNVLLAMENHIRAGVPRGDDGEAEEDKDIPF